jgi:DNA polymerase I-like protein with 3'-5' exonuclease and polymerase domains
MENLIALDANSKVWLYHSDRVFEEDEIPEIKQKIFEFVRSWVSHNRALKSYGNLFHQRIIALFVDESQAGASGCSIDSSVHFIQKLGMEHKSDFFNRMIFSYVVDEQVTTVSSADFKKKYASGEINDNTMVFDNLVKTKEEFISSWVKPLGESWLKRFAV